MHFRTYPPNALLNSSHDFRDEGGCETSYMGMANVLMNWGKGQTQREEYTGDGSQAWGGLG
jgi:hypothetical protein